MASTRTVGFARRLLGILFALPIAGCTGVFDLGAPRATGPDPVGFPECQAESYDFVGEGTLTALGLDVATPVPPPDPDRVAMIWVTHDLLPYDAREPGGPVEMVRMLCFEFPDGSGGSEWPVDPTWQPPGSAPRAGQGDDSNGAVPPTVLLAGVIAAVVFGVSVVAFRSPRTSLEEAGNRKDHSR